LKGLAHITGGGITDNLPRILPRGCGAEIRVGSWPVLPVFDLIARLGKVPEEDMFRTFNMGVGMLLVVDKEDSDPVIRSLQKRREKFYKMGCVTRGRRSVRYERARSHEAGLHGEGRA
ncbi:MAG: AIR synthase-related protein, partial [Terriglobia bacterium]